MDGPHMGYPQPAGDTMTGYCGKPVVGDNYLRIAKASSTQGKSPLLEVKIEGHDRCRRSRWHGRRRILDPVDTDTPRFF
jgi:hypothetical protein